MHYGIPVIASSFSSIPEICGDAAMYFNPLSIEEIMSRILLILDKSCRDTFSQKAKDRYIEITNRQGEDLNALVDYLYAISNHND